MRILSYRQDDRIGLALQTGEGWLDLRDTSNSLPDDIADLLRLPDWRERVTARAATAPSLDLESVEFLPPVRKGEKILCVGLNYLDHVAESPYPIPEYPIFFPRFASSLVGHGAPLVKSFLSDQFDYEGELVVVIGKGGRHISRDSALDHVAGYTIFNEASMRDYQFKSPQWTMGKNFDGTGACGPWFVSADELPPGASGLRLETRVNGKVEQSASTAEMLFDVSTLIALASQVMTLRPGDMIVSGTPSGVGFGKKPPVYLNANDVCEVSIEGIGILRNTVMDEPNLVEANKLS